MITKLKAAPQAYSFFQAVRLLERAAAFDQGQHLQRRLGSARSIGAFTPPSQELIRLRASHSLRFPEAEISSLAVHHMPGQASAWTMAVSFMGLTGAMGVLPFHYTELVLERLKLKDETLAHFLDIFNHRTLSLFYRAATKYRLPLAYEKAQTPGALSNGRDMPTRALLSLIGLGTRRLEDRQQVKDESLIFYSGLLAQQIRTSSGLRQMLEDYFEVPVRIGEFFGQWEELMEDARSRLASRSNPKGQNAQLGRSIVFGRKGWFAQCKIRIHIGPLKQHQLQRFAPGTKTLQALNQMVRFYLGSETDYDFVIEVDRKDLSQNVSLSKRNPAIMGWNTWLSGGEAATTRYREKILAIRVSASRVA